MGKSPGGFRAMLWGTLALFLPFVSVKRLVDIDYESELRVNPSFGNQTPGKLAVWRTDYSKTVEQRLSDLRAILCSAFVWLGVGVALACVVVWLNGSLSAPTKALLGVLSVFCFAWATLARLGRNSLSIGGNTAVEWLDLRVLWLLYWFGTFFGTLALI